MASGAASTRGASQPETGASPPDVVAEEVYERRSSDFETRHHTTPRASWEKEEAIAATRRAGDALRKVPFGGDGDALREVLREVHLHLEAPGADRAAKAFTLIADVDRKSLKAVAREVRDVLVLRCLSEIEPRDRGHRDSFLEVVAKAFGQTPQTLSRTVTDIILHSHRKATKNRPDAFLSKTQMKPRRRKRRCRPDRVGSGIDAASPRFDIGSGGASQPAAPDVQLEEKMSSAVALFLAGGDFSDGASASDETEFDTTTDAGQASASCLLASAPS